MAKEGEQQDQQASGSSGKKEQPIIVKKIKKGGHAPHGGAWKVAYADFVTAMMAFFIVMWIVSASESTKEAITAYFQDPGAFNFLTGKPTIPIDLGMTPQPGKDAGEERGQGPGEEHKKFTAYLSEEQMDQLVDKVTEKQIENAIRDSTAAALRVEETANKIRKVFDELAQENPEFNDLINSIEIQLFDDGLRIELIEDEEQVFFKVGSSELRKPAIAILKKLAFEIGKLPNQLEIEGHTDSRGFGNGRGGYTNWELSSDRANSSRRVMASSGLWEGQILRVTGYADRMLRIPENPFDKSNRRITLFVRQIDTEKFLKDEMEKGQYEVTLD